MGDSMQKGPLSRKREHGELPVLYMVSPCFNEQDVLPKSYALFLDQLHKLVSDGIVSPESRILFVDDGSSDATWQIIERLSDSHAEIEGISLSGNRGHQNALTAGLLVSMNRCDVCISLDCDGQHDPAVMREMLVKYDEGFDVVYAVRTSRDTDSFFKKLTSQGFYGLLKVMGVDTIPNAADYRLMSARVLRAFSRYREVNLYLRGLVPLLGFKSTTIEYTCRERLAGHSHYSLKKMLSLAGNGITSMSVQPLHIIFVLGAACTVLGLVWIAYNLVAYFMGHAVPGWTSTICAICLFGGVQLLSLGIIGEYVGKIYMESKARPRYLVEESTFTDLSDEEKLDDVSLFN